MTKYQEKKSMVDQWIESARQYIVTEECDCDCFRCIQGDHHDNCQDLDCGDNVND